MGKIKLRPFAIIPSYSTSSAYTLVLAEMEGNRKLPVVIGEGEAQAIALDLENIKPPRPLTHELMKTIMLSFNLTVAEITIERFHEGIFYSTVSVLDQDGNYRDIDARTSDAIAMALKFNCSIFATEQVLEEAAIILEQPEFKEEMAEETKENDLTTMSLEHLSQLLKEAESNEEYEDASKIMAEIERRKHL